MNIQVDSIEVKDKLNYWTREGKIRKPVAWKIKQKSATIGFSLVTGELFLPCNVNRRQKFNLVDEFSLISPCDIVIPTLHELLSSNS
jgi:hypothetical protein